MLPNQSQTLGAAAGVPILVAVIFALFAAVFTVIICWRICSKAGYSGAMGLLMFIPIANIIVLCILAFGKWPIYRELERLRR